MKIRNFLFHRVSDEKDKLWPPLPPKAFEGIIRFLKKKYHIVALEEYLSDPGQFKTEKNIVTLSFDDGYKDNVEYAAPVLKKYNCPASFYVVTDCVEKNIPTWTYIVDHSFQNAVVPFIALSMDYVPEHLKKVDLKNPAKNLKQVKPWMKTLSNRRRKEVLQEILDESGVAIPGHLMMNWDDIKQLHHSGFYISSHSHTHPMLARLETEEEIREELMLSRRKIEEHLGIQPSTISYPMGSFDTRVMTLVKEAGYKWGLAVEQKFFETSDANLLAIPRVELYFEPKWKIHARINGIYNSIKRIWE
jgi:peptidoglycan/xylan/chitin deacetylase (PgdA/CDA1 family)